MLKVVRKSASPSAIQERDRVIDRLVKDKIQVMPVDVRELMSIVHKRINVLSGSMVLAFKNGPTPSDFAAWADELRTCAAQLDRTGSQ